MTKRWLTSALLLTGLFGLVRTAAAQETYQVTVTNLVHGTPPSLIPNNFGTSVDLGTSNEVFGDKSCVDANGTARVGEMLGLWVFITHDSSFSLFNAGQPARRELAMLSQTGRPFFLRDSLVGAPGIGQVFSIPSVFPPPNGPRGIVLCPGQSLTTTVTAKGNARWLSLAAMIFPTNDGFVGVTGVPLPDGNDPVVVYSPAYDSGSEENDEICGNIPSLRGLNFPFPGTTKGGGGKAPGAACPDGFGLDNDINSDFTNPLSPDNNPLRAEGNVHIHPGIRGVGDLDPRVWGWDGNALKVTIQKTR